MNCMLYSAFMDVRSRNLASSHPTRKQLGAGVIASSNPLMQSSPFRAQLACAWGIFNHGFGHLLRAAACGDERSHSCSSSIPSVLEYYCLRFIAAFVGSKKG